MENPRFARAARQRRLTAISLAILFHVLLIAGLAYMGAGGADNLFGGNETAAVEVQSQPTP